MRLARHAAPRLALFACLLAACGCSGGASNQPAASGSSQRAQDENLVASVDSALAAGGAEPADPIEIGDDSDPDDATFRRGWLGVELAAAEAFAPGVRVRSVVRGSPAAKAGVRAGDVILTIDGEVVAQPADVIRLIGERRAGQKTSVGLLRGGENRLLAVTLGRVPAEDDVLRMSFIGAPAPAFVGLQTVQGSFATSIGALRGKVVVIEFWAPWCVACRFLVPTMNDWYEHFRPQGVEVIGITMEPVLQASQAAQQLGMRYSLASDFSGETSRAYRAHAIPSLFVVDRKGMVRDVMVGYSSSKLESLRSLVGRLLAEP